MFRSFSFLLLCGLAASATAGEVQPAKSAPGANALRQQYAANLARAEKDQEESHARISKLITRDESLMARKEQEMAREERDMAKFEAILATWQRQQAQYQRYLDSLGKK